MIKIKDPITFKKILESIDKLGENVQISLIENALYFYGLDESKTLFFKVVLSNIEIPQEKEKIEDKTINIYIKDLKNQAVESESNDELFFDIDDYGVMLKKISNDSKVITTSKLMDLYEPMNIKDQLENLNEFFKDIEIEFKVEGEKLLKLLKLANYYSNEIDVNIKKNSIILENQSSLGNFNSEIEINLDTSNKFRNRYSYSNISNALVFKNLNNEIIMKIIEDGPIITKTEIDNDSYCIIIISPLVGG